MNFPSKNITISNDPAIVYGDKAVSYAQFFRSVVQTEHYLRDSGIQSGDRVGIVSPNSLDYLTAVFALWKIKAVACLLSTRLPEHAIGEQLRSLQCRHLLVPGAGSNTDNVQMINLGDMIKPEGYDTANEADSNEIQNFYEPMDQEATVIFTSGSTSAPKAVLHTLGNHYFSAKGSNEHLPVVPGDQWLLSLPLYHVGGLGIIFRTFLGGGCVTIPKPDEPINIMLEKHKITHLSLVSTQLIRLLRDAECQDALKKLKVILLGGSAIPDSLIEDAIKLGLPIYSTYGLTEMASQVATSNRLSGENRISAGKILNYRQLMISEEGEILVKGETLFKEYIEHAGLSMPFNKNGYFTTGDIGDFLENGRLIVKGRKDNLFISGGENIQPEEIEKYLCRIKNIERAIVVPVADSEFGFRPAVVIKTKEGYSVNEAEISEFLLDHLPKFKIPKQFYAWPDHVDADIFKVDRQEISRAIFLAESNPS